MWQVICFPDLLIVSQGCVCINSGCGTFCFPTVYYLMRSLSPNSGRGRVNTSGEAMMHEVKSWTVCRANLRAVRGVTESG